MARSRVAALMQDWWDWGAGGGGGGGWTGPNPNPRATLKRREQVCSAPGLVQTFCRYVDMTDGRGHGVGQRG